MIQVQDRKTTARIAGTMLNIRAGKMQFLQRLSDCPLKWQNSLTVPGGSTKASL